MQKSKLIGFNAAKIAEQMMANAVAEQNRRLVEYAGKEIKVLGDKISSYAGAHHLDRTGNLLNSLCWGVSYNGKMVESGFYREAVTHSYVNRWGQERGMGVKGGSSSYLHEWNDPMGEEVNGRQLAEDFIKSFKGREKGWSIFFAVLAPYWGYWESGFILRGGGGNSGIPRHSRFMQFQVMTHIFDDARMALKPAKTHLSVYVPKYAGHGTSSKAKKYKNKPFTKKLDKEL